MKTRNLKTTEVNSTQRNIQTLVTPREFELIRYLRNQDLSKRHEILLECRGSEPFCVVEHVSKARLELKPEDATK